MEEIKIVFALKTEIKMKKFGPFLIGGSFYPLRFSIAIPSFLWPKWFKDDYRSFKSLVKDSSEFPIKASCPVFIDKKAEAGSFRDYFIQDLYMAQKIFKANPRKHVDIGSRIDGFVANVASFREIELLDIRDVKSKIPNVSFKQADLMNAESIESNYCDSISCLHALEHFGLGRYGDPIDPDGHLKGYKNITKMLISGGTFYFSVPIGPQRIEFNGHRVFSLPYLLKMVSQDYDVVSFSYIDDLFHLHQDVDIHSKQSDTSYGCNFGIALFELQKKVIDNEL